MKPGPGQGGVEAALHQAAQANISQFVITPTPCRWPERLSRSLRRLFVCIWLILGCRLVAQVPTYTGTEINSQFLPTAINASGQMAGTVDAPPDSGGTVYVHAARLSGGVITDLGTLGGRRSEATGINASGQIVGNSERADGLTHAFVYSNGAMIDLGTLPGGATSYATAINDAGQITGWSDTVRPNTNFPRPDHAFLYSGGSMVDLGNISTAPDSFGNFSVGTAINSAGEVVGWSIDANFNTHAFLYSGGQMMDLGTLGGTESRATGINDSGIVVGFSNTTGDAATHAFRSNHGAGLVDLGTLPGQNGSSATAINNAGQIIGTSRFSGTPAFIYTEQTGMVKLDTRVSGDSWTLSRALAINSPGQIIASGSTSTVFGGSFLLTPTGGAPTAPGNISTRLRVESGDNSLIGGFIITGTQPKKVILRAIGPSLPVPGKLANPILELRGSNGALIGSNDNWRTAQEAEIIATTVPPSDNLESAIVATLPANNSAYTAIVRGVGGNSGVGLVEVYDLDRAADSQLANISTRGFVQTGDDVMIGGIIMLGSAPRRIIVRAIGPSLPVTGKLADPTLELIDSNGATTASNDNWRSTQEAEIIATSVPPTNNLESALVTTVNAAPYTAIVRGKNGGIGVGLVEVFVLN